MHVICLLFCVRACMLCHDSIPILSQIIYKLKFSVHVFDCARFIIGTHMHLSFFGALKWFSEAIYFKLNIVNTMLFASKQNAYNRIATHIRRERQKMIVNSVKMLAKAAYEYNLCNWIQSFILCMFVIAFFFLSSFYKIDLILVESPI